ncbi:MAG: DUF3794 domain-containing protein [Clostridia bacterium]|nr:DUF3794 domain-containing protein [Clostridia bacterium]
MAAIRTKTVSLNETFCCTSFEHQCESEATLPEYLPDISSIIRVDARPLLLSHTVKNGRAELTGRVDCILLYSPGQGAMQSYCTRVPFTAEVPDCEFPEGARCFGQVRMNTVLCRPLSGRKVSLKCAVLLTVQGEKTTECNLVDADAAKEAGLETLTETAFAARSLGQVTEEFSIEEMLELPEDSPRMARILKCDTDAGVQELRAGAGRVVVGGELSVHCLYLSNVDTGETGQHKAAVPFNRVIELPGLLAEDVVAVDLTVSDSACGILEDAAGEERILSCKVGITACVRVWRNQELVIVRDCYAGQEQAEVQMVRRPVETVLSSSACKLEISDSFLPGESVTAVHAAEAFADVRDCVAEGGQLRVRGDLLVSFLVTGLDGQVSGIDHIFPFDAACLPAGEGIQPGSCSALCRLTGFSYQMAAGGAVFVSAQLECSLLAKSRSQLTALGQVILTPMETKPTGHCLTLYYPEEGEPLWEIGKRYLAPLDVIRRTNGIEGDAVPAGMKMLMIER